MRASLLALVLAAVLFAGCGGGGKGGGHPNGEASKSPTQVLADAKAAATSGSSVHVSGNIVASGTPVKLDLTIAHDKAKGSMSANGLAFDLVRVGNAAYIRGSDAFYKHFAGAALANLLHGKWLKVSATNAQFGRLIPLTNIGALFRQISSHHGKLAKAGTTTFQGQSVVAIRDMSDNSKLYVAASGKPYPVAIVGGRKNQSGTITFSNWDQAVSVSAPQGALDISKLSGG